MNTIIYIGGFELPDNNAAAQRVVNNGKIFKSLGYNVVYIGIDKQLPQKTDVLTTKRIHFGFDCWSVPYPKGNLDWLKTLFSIDPVMQIIDKVYKDTFCALICYNYQFPAQFRLRRICNSHKAMYIPDATEWYAASGPNPLVKIIKWLDTTLRMRYMHPRADGLIVTSPYLAEYYKKKNCKTVELPSLFDTSETENNQKVKREKAHKRRRLVYAGNPFNAKSVDKQNIKDRLDYVIEMAVFAHEQGLDFMLEIFGVNKNEYLKYFPEHKKILDLAGKKICFKGPVPRLKVIGAIQKADFTIFMREANRVTEAGFPTKFSESISYGTPVITNRLSNINDYLIEGKTGFSVDLADKELRHNTFLRILQLKNGDIEYTKKYCLESRLFDYNNHVDSVEAFLKSICEGN